MLQLLEVFERPGTSLDIIVKHIYKEKKRKKKKKKKRKEKKKKDNINLTEKSCDGFFSPVSTKQSAGAQFSLSPVAG
jgi:hypothetical protein